MPNITRFAEVYGFQLIIVWSALTLLYDAYWLDQQSGDRYDGTDFLVIAVLSVFIVNSVGGQRSLLGLALPQMGDK